MKRIFVHPEPTQAELTGPHYWRSLDDKSQSPEFRNWLEREFPSGAAELSKAEGSMDRRHFLKIMAASFGLAGLSLSGCREPEKTVLSYGKQPEGVVPGVARFFATALPQAQGAIPLIVESHENRPTKIEGNPSYLPYGGATNAFAQASVLDLYDPDRSTSSLDMQGQKELVLAQVKELCATIHERYKARSGQGLAFLIEPSASPSKQKIFEQLQAIYPKALYCAYSPVDFLNAQDGYTQAYQRPIRPIYHFDKAYRVLALDADFLHTEPDHIKHTRDFTKLRKLKSAQDAKSLNRLYAVESNYTLSGGMADHRLRLHAHDMDAFAAKMVAAILRLKKGPQNLIDLCISKASHLNVDQQWIDECARDLVAYAGASLVVGGFHLSADTHALIALANAYLGAPGHTLSLVEVPQNVCQDNLDTLAQAIQARKIQTLFIIGGNPAYNAPAGLDWPSLQAKIPQVLRWGTHIDETSSLSHIHLAGHHYLESWGDDRAWDGTYFPIQPLMAPLYATLSELELLSYLLGIQETDAYTTVLDTFKAFAGEVDFETCLAEGLLRQSAYKPSQEPYIYEKELGALLRAKTYTPFAGAVDNLELRLCLSSQVGDGQYSNNAWLQECPEALNKTTWDNMICISPRLAKDLEAKTGKRLFPESLLSKTGQLNAPINTFEKGKEKSWLAEISVNGTTLKGPLHIQPGLAHYTVVLSFGYGRKKAGRVGDKVGFDIYPLFKKEGMYTLDKGVLRILDETAFVANTQEHWSMEGRAIIREANAQDYAMHPYFVQHMGLESHTPPVYGEAKNLSLSEKVTTIPQGGSLYKTPAFGGAQQWGMTIDLNSCTGCNACVLACQSENNIPVIGKDQVLRGREMHWIRLDRYYSTGSTHKEELPDDPQVAFMGMLCQHCELAPCETVCPVNATVHSEEGLNVMAYNRCVGTRYCANNCPYKVRRFNFFDWNKRERDHYYEGPFGPSGMAETLKMQKNPDVTVRMRGVMEKCTYCVQRIEQAKITQRNKAKDSGNVKVPDGAIKTACQQVCPAEAISFGDVADPETEVSKLKSQDRNYEVLAYLNTRPRTSYLARIRNPNPAMPDYYLQPLSTIEYNHKQGHSSH